MRHLLITISDLQSLTDVELNRLEATLRHILETAIDLTETERGNIITSLKLICVAVVSRLTLTSHVMNQ
jgi:hypothetical protein